MFVPRQIDTSDDLSGTSINTYPAGFTFSAIERNTLCSGMLTGPHNIVFVSGKVARNEKKQTITIVKISWERIKTDIFRDLPRTSLFAVSYST
jgi:hypothetical protein